MPLALPPPVQVYTLTWLRYSGSLTTPSCSEGVDGVIIVAPVVISDEATDAASELMRSTTRYIQGKLGKPNLLLQAAKT